MTARRFLVFRVLQGISRRVLKGLRDQTCNHLTPGENAFIGRWGFQVTHCKLAEVPKASAVQARLRDGGQIDEIDRWLVDQLMKIALSPGLYGHAD